MYLPEVQNSHIYISVRKEKNASQKASYFSPQACWHKNTQQWQHKVYVLLEKTLFCLWFLHSVPMYIYIYMHIYTGNLNGFFKKFLENANVLCKYILCMCYPLNAKVNARPNWNFTLTSANPCLRSAFALGLL